MWQKQTVTRISLNSILTSSSSLFIFFLNASQMLWYSFRFHVVLNCFIGLSGDGVHLYLLVRLFTLYSGANESVAKLTGIRCFTWLCESRRARALTLKRLCCCRYIGPIFLFFVVRSWKTQKKALSRVYWIYSLLLFHWNANRHSFTFVNYFAPRIVIQQLLLEIHSVWTPDALSLIIFHRKI